MKDATISELYDLTQTIAAKIFGRQNVSMGSASAH